MKSVSAQTWRPDLTRDEFHRHYEEEHVPLAVRYLPFGGYVRNHVIGSPDIWFATITEFWANDLADLGKALQGEAGPIMAADEEKFMVRDKIAGGLAEEHLLSDGEPANASGERSVVLVRWNGVEPGEAVGALGTWARKIAAGQKGVSLDLVESSFYTDIAFPADALLWLPDFDAAPPPPPELGITPLRVRRFETPKAALLGAL